MSGVRAMLGCVLRNLYRQSDVVTNRSAVTIRKLCRVFFIATGPPNQAFSVGWDGQGN
jgi:hypothetical protein